MTTTPDTAQADRQARRKHLADLILRMRRGELHSQGRDILAAVLKDEQADADQAREQLAAARALRFGAHDIEVCNQQRAAYTGLRIALQSAFGVGDTVSDDDLFECVRQQAADLAAARAGDAPWITAYREDIATAEISARAHKTAATEALERAEAAEATVRDYEHRLSWETTCGKHAALLDSCRNADERAARAERDLADMHAAESAAAAAGSYAERAEKAEAAITRVRRVAGWAANSWTDLSPEKVLAALGDPQPATAPDADRTVAYRNVIRRGALLCRDDGNNLQGSIPLTSEDLPDGGICTECGADVLIKPEVLAAACGPEAQWDAAAPGREQPTEPPPTISVIDQVAAALIAASRYLRGDTQ